MLITIEASDSACPSSEPLKKLDARFKQEKIRMLTRFLFSYKGGGGGMPEVMRMLMMMVIALIGKLKQWQHLGQ